MLKILKLEVKYILKSKLGKLCFVFLIICSSISFIQVLEADNHIHTYNEINKELTNFYIYQQRMIEYYKSEYSTAKIYGNQSDIIAKETRLKGQQWFLDDLEKTIKNFRALDKKDDDKINELFIEQTIHYKLWEAAQLGSSSFNDDDPIKKTYRKQIIAHPNLMPILDNPFDFQSHSNANYLFGGGIELVNKHYKFISLTKEIDSLFYMYEKNYSVGIYDNRGPGLWFSIVLSNDSFYGICYLLCGLVFMFLSSYQFHNIKMDQYYANFALSRGKLYTILLLGNLISFIIMVVITLGIPFIVLGFLFGFHTLDYPSLLDSGLISTYHSATRGITDGFSWFSAYPSTNPISSEVSWFPTIAQSINIVSYWKTLIIYISFAFLQIISIGIIAIGIGLIIKKRIVQFIFFMISSLLLVITRFIYIPIISVFPIFSPSPIYLSTGGHGIGLISIYLIFIIWLFGTYFISKMIYQKMNIL